MASDHRLCPLPLVTAPDSIDLSSRPRPDALQGIVADFAEKSGHACFVENQFVAIDGKLSPRLALPIFQRLHPIVKACDGHTTLAIVKCGQQLRESDDRICNRSAKNARVQIHFGTSYLDLERGYSA